MNYMHYYTYGRGFTLLELLMVIAIIGILAAIVLTALSTSRNRGSDANIKSNMKQAQVQAQVYFDLGTDTFVGVCTTPKSSRGIQDILQAAMRTYNNTTAYLTTGTLQAAGAGVCHDSTSAWVASIPLKGLSSSYWCVDSTGASKAVTGLIAASGMACPAL